MYGGSWWNSTADVHDTIHMYGLAPDVEVADVIDVESGLFCYRY